MSLIYEKLNILAISKGIICHGVNCQGKMGAGVAKYIRVKWPIVFSQYNEYCLSKSNKVELMGKVNLVRISEDLFVANCFTQLYYGREQYIYADIASLTSSLQTLFDLNEKVYKLPIYMTKIGCGLGGLNWERDVEPVMIELSKKYSFNITVCLFD